MGSHKCKQNVKNKNKNISILNIARVAQFDLYKIDIHLTQVITRMQKCVFPFFLTQQFVAIKNCQKLKMSK